MLPIEARRRHAMSDVILVVVIAAFFGVAILYTRFCDRI
jgi:hypothetical protein